MKEFYILENPSIDPTKILIWAAGINVDFWNLNKRGKKNLNVLFYIKNEEKELLEKCKEIVLRYDLIISEIFYGNYKMEEFKEALINADCVVYFSISESQGIALAEIWATDIPTFVWNPGIFNYHAKSYNNSSAPYLTNEVGRFFKNSSEFEIIISDFKSCKDEYNPREYTLKHFSDKHSAKNFIKKLECN